MCTRRTAACTTRTTGASTIPDALVVIERWESEEHLAAHAAAPHMKAFSELAAEHRAGPSDVVRYQMVPIDGHPDKSHF